MNSEIEAKFLSVNHDEIRTKLVALGGKLIEPDRLMKRVVIHTPEMTEKNAFIRIRDEGSRTTITYKQFDADSIDGAKEHEIIVDDFDTTVAIFAAAGLNYDTYQESRRENWELDGIEIMLDEWPWIPPYIEIEGPSEELVQHVARKLDLDWNHAVFGGVANAYRHHYPYIGEDGITEINQNWPVIKFTDQPPALLTQADYHQAP